METKIKFTTKATKIPDELKEMINVEGDMSLIAVPTEAVAGIESLDGTYDIGKLELIGKAKSSHTSGTRRV